MQQAASGGREGWDLANASFPTSYGHLYVGNQDVQPEGIFFKPDGTRLYLAGRSNEKIYEYDLSTAWDVASASFSQDVSVSTNAPDPSDVFFKPDGSEMFITSRSDRSVVKYTLSTSWDISTASYSQAYTNDRQRFQSVGGLAFKSDGTKLVIISPNRGLTSYDLATAWDLSSLAKDRQVGAGSLVENPEGIFFKSDGTSFWLAGEELHEYSLSTAWDLSTISSVQSVSYEIGLSSPSDVFFKSDGSEFFVLDYAIEQVFSYDLTTNYDISTRSWNAPNANYVDVGDQGIFPEGVSFKSDGTKMFVVFSNFASSKVSEYDLSTAWDVASASFSQSYTITTTFGDENPKGIFFRPNGTDFYIVGIQNDYVYQYELSTAWDLSTASYRRFLDVSSVSTNPLDVFFKPDGTRMFIIDSSLPDEIRVYDLSTAWDISTASLSTVKKDLTGITSSPQGFYFREDGLKMYISDTVFKEIIELDLSTAWDVSTASSVQTFSTSEQFSDPYGIFFKPDGKKMNVISGGFDAVWTFRL